MGDEELDKSVGSIRKESSCAADACESCADDSPSSDD